MNYTFKIDFGGLFEPKSGDRVTVEILQKTGDEYEVVFVEYIPASEPLALGVAVADTLELDDRLA